MKTSEQWRRISGLAAIALAGVLPTDLTALGAESHEQEIKAEEDATAEQSLSADLERLPDTKPAHNRPGGWLGVTTAEAGEALAAQLGLEPGVGLSVTYVAPDSPASEIGIKKNDLLVECQGQPLVHPAQLRKLIQVRKPGDTISLAYYRAGKKETTTATLRESPPGFAGLEHLAPDHGPWQELQSHLRNLPLQEWKEQLRELPMKEALREQMKEVQKSLRHVQIDQKKVQAEVRRSMEQARKSLQDALRSLKAAEPGLDPARRALQELGRSGVSVDDDTTVTLRSTGRRSQSIVKTDDAGTLVIVSNPKPHLTAHDKQGKLLFDGKIETADERSKVPPDVWRRVEPLLEKLTPPLEDQENEEE